MRWTGVAAVLAAAAVLAGCGERSEPTGTSVAIYPVTVRSVTGKAIALTRAPQRVAALTPGGAEILAALGAGNRVLGRPANGRRGAAPRAAVVVDDRGQIVLHRLTSLRPDLVVASPDFSAGELARAAARVHAPVYVAPENSVEDVEQAIGDIGLLVDEPVAARSIIGKIEDARRRVQTRVGGSAPVSVFVDTGFFTTVPDRSLVGDMIRIAHGRNVAGPSPDPGPLNPSDLVHLKPRVYIATSDSGTSLRALRKNRVTRRLGAVRAGRFSVIRSGLLEPGPGVAKGLLAVARLLHPHAFR